MKQLGKVLNKTSWAQASNTINTNSESVFSAVTMLENAAFKHKGYFLTSKEVEQLYPSAEEGSQAFVYNSSNPSTAPYDIYQMIGGTWADTGLNGGNVNVNLDSKQDTLVGYSESVSGGKATQVAIQGDTIALSGKVSLGNVDDMESAILMSSSQAGAAVAKANTVEQSMSALKSPVKPIHLNSQGKLELNIGKGLYVEDGKLCTTGASGGGGGGTTLSEGQGIRIYNDTINVAYDIDTLRVNSCGGLTVNYGEGLTIKNGKLSAQTSVNAGNGLVQKGDELSVNISAGLQYGSDGELAVKTGKGLSVDNTGTINANIDNSTIATNSDGAMYVQKGMLAGQGLKVSLDRLAVNYGNGLTISNKALVIDYGAGLDIQDGKLVSTVQGGKTYVAGDAIGFNGNNINVRYDGVTISTKGTTDRSLHVMLGSGLKQGSNGIDVAVGEGLAIGSDNKLYSTVSSGKTYTAGDGISIKNNQISVSSSVRNALTTLRDSVKGKQDTLTLATGLEWGDTNMIQVKMNAPLNYDNCGRLMLNYDSTLTVSDYKLRVNPYGIIDNEGGLTYNNKGLGVNVGRGLKIESCQVVVDYGTGLKVVNNKLDVDTSKIAGVGIDLDSDYKRLTIGTKAAKELAGTGLVADGPKMKVKFGSGLTTNTCGGLIVDAANLTVGNANKLGGVLASSFPKITKLFEKADYQHYVVLLCKYGSGLTAAAHRLTGRIYTESPGYDRYSAADVDIFASNWNDGSQAFFRFDTYGLNDLDLITCNYGGVRYLAIRMAGTQARTMYFEGTATSMLLTPIHYYTSNTNTAHNTEINGSISKVTVSQPLSNGNRYALVTDTVARATADSQGNNIAATYAKRFTPTNGLAINNDRILYLPNLTASVVNGAADGSKNGAQRVLNLSCGAIQIKLSTGLAIDDLGYLYIQDKYVTK